MTATSTMTHRERWLAALELKPVDRLPFWPKLCHPHFEEYGKAKGLNDAFAVFDYIGADPHLGVGGEVREVHNSCEHRQKEENGAIVREYVTPVGTARTVLTFDPGSWSHHPTEMPVKDEEDLKILTAYYNDASWEVDADGLEAAKARKAEIGERACTQAGIGESALMIFVEHLAGVAEAHYFLLDYPDETEELFDAIHRNLMRKAEVQSSVAQADLLYMVENTSTTLVSPDQYRKYCLPHLKAYADILHANGKKMCLHMCGHLKDLLPDIYKVGADAYEAFTSPTVGNTTLLDGRTACPKTCLIGGTNANLWLQPAETIIETLRKDLDALPHHRGVIPTSAGMMPPAATLETIKQVCEFVQEYPVKL